MENVDQAQEGITDGEAVVVPPTEPVTPAPHGDPLDDIQDPVARAEAKKARAIVNRHKDKPVEPLAVPAQAASKDDLAKLVTAQAKEKVSADVRDNWDELLKIPLGGYDPLDAASIAKNMENRLALYKLNNPAKPENAAAQLQTTTGTPGSGASAPVAPTGGLNINLPKPATEWYGTK